ncbi:MAG: hypothetical protein HKP30_16725 [Myxococcales bacterium]|nr:hypothetical protein [Myxococcales bacterium]
MSLADLIRSDAKILEIAQHLDGLDHETRLAETRTLTGPDQKKLFRAAEESPPLDFAFFVPDAVPDRTQVVHHGKNSQPAFKFFQKRWCRPADREGALYGYNETAVRPLIGPGYFVAHETADGGRDPRGAIVVDYFQVPQTPVAPGWPAVKPNSAGLQRFVYDKTRDYMRRVSKHVSIGEAHRLEKSVLGWFVLCREDV